VSRLNEGFIRPEYPQQVPFSYYQASIVFDLIESRWGLPAILAMLDGYRRGKTSEAVFREVLGESPEEFDKLFDDFVRDRWGDEIQAVSAHGQQEELSHPGQPRGLSELRQGSLQRPGSFHARLAYGQALFESGDYGEAEKELKAALALFPEYGGVDGPFFYLARIHEARGETELAARALHQLGLLNETHFSIHLEESGKWLEVGDTTAAIEALEKAVEIVPFQVEPHERLALLYERAGNSEGAVRERRAILALDPADRAAAHFRLAKALLGAGDPEEARSQVLRALELAPTFEPALELLLELKGIGGEARMPLSGPGGGPKPDQSGREAPNSRGVS
jgi:tetratricopeptide (TPR) repeat protein